MKKKGKTALREALQGLRRSASASSVDPERRRGFMISIGVGHPEVGEQEGVGTPRVEQSMMDPGSETQGWASDDDEELPGRRRR